MPDDHLTKILDDLLDVCTCFEGYTSRGLTDPHCDRCSLGPGVTALVERYEREIAALTAALAARDAEATEFKIALADSEEECIDLRGALKKRDAEVARLNAAVDRMLADHLHETVKLTGEAVRLRETLGTVRRLLDEIGAQYMVDIVDDALRGGREHE